MFQNINEDTIEINNKTEKAKRNVNIFSNVLTKENLAIYVVAFMMSLVGIGGDFSIFSISVLGACFASSVPALGVVAVSLLGNFIKFGVGGGLGYFLTALVLIITLFIFKPRYNEEERNEKIKIGKNVFIATLLIQIVKIAMAQFTLYDVLASITLSIIALVFYKIFVNSIVVVQEFYEKRAFSIEEVIGASLMLAIAVGGIGDFNVAGFSIRNILSILIVMVLGWKNGMLIGTTSGVTIGVTLGVITNSEPIMIAAYAISGMIAGILNRFGKIGVVVGFALGNILLAYVANGYTVELIHFKEILIASIGLLFVPKTLQIDIEEFTGKSKLLPSMSDRALNKSKEVAESLNNVSNAINEMATTYRGQDDLDAVEKDNISSDENKEIFIGELLNNLEPYKDNMLYDDIAKADGEIDNEIFELLLEKQEISRKDLLQIFANCNSYIVGAEDNKISKQLEGNIMQIVRTINVSYKVAKSNFIWKKKEEQTKKNISNQLKNVSNAIKSMAKDIEKDIKAEEKYQAERLEIVDLLRQRDIEVQDIMIKKDNRFIVEIYLTRLLENTKLEQIAEILTNILKEPIVLNAEATVGKKIVYLSDDKYIMTIGMAQETKNNSKQSGDSILNIRLKDGKYLVAISDGMGSGKEAKNSSNQTLRLLENLLVSGFDKKASLDLINNALMNQNKETFATLDIAIVDLYEGNVEFIKSAACPTYIKKNKRVQMIRANSLPTGILEESKLETFDKDINDGEIVVLCSDGILDSNVEYKNKELWIKYLLEDIETTNTQKIANLILEESVDNNYGIAKDDMSVVAFKFRQK